MANTIVPSLPSCHGEYHRAIIGVNQDILCTMWRPRDDHVQAGLVLVGIELVEAMLICQYTFMVGPLGSAIAKERHERAVGMTCVEHVIVRNYPEH